MAMRITPPTISMAVQQRAEAPPEQHADGVKPAATSPITTAGPDVHAEQRQGQPDGERVDAGRHGEHDQRPAPGRIGASALLVSVLERLRSSCRR